MAIKSYKPTSPARRQGTVVDYKSIITKNEPEKSLTIGKRRAHGRNHHGVITAKQLSKYRTLVIFGTFIFGAIATPSTDPFSMLALAAPMSLLFLTAEVIAHILDRRKARRAKAAGDDLLIAGSVADDKALRELSDEDGPAPA